MAPNDSILPEYCTDTNSLWVFGYGSLLWKPNFEYSAVEIGHVRGYVRRFWQGNTTHRGVPGKPGRVATLVKQDGGTTWGMAFFLQGETQIINALSHLYSRECRLGGYTFHNITFHTRSGQEHQVVAFTATPECDHYMGPATVDTIAGQIVASRGLSGHNLEYLFRLAETVRSLIPEDEDEHLFGLEAKARRILRCLNHRTPSQDLFMVPVECKEEMNNNNNRQAWVPSISDQTLVIQ